jgi:hypothetical protein
MTSLSSRHGFSRAATPHPPKGFQPLRVVLLSVVAGRFCLSSRASAARVRFVEAWGFSPTKYDPREARFRCAVPPAASSVLRVLSLGRCFASEPPRCGFGLSRITSRESPITALVTFLPLLYSRMNMNRIRRNPLKTNDRCTFYSIKISVLHGRSPASSSGWSKKTSAAAAANRT